LGIIQLPGMWGRGEVERAALRRGLATGSLVRLVEVPPNEAAEARAYCAGCAGPVEFGAVIRAGRSSCSIECSLEGGDTA
jgi:hypothetical protein